jgi:hypothetical protein
VQFVAHEPQDMAGARIAAAIAAASVALHRPVSDPVPLQSGSDWSVVLRCQDSAGGTVIVKTYPLTAEGASSFAAEAAGLALADGTGLTPAFIAAEPTRHAVVMSDLGSAPSMADVLLSSSQESARAALLSWADACGRLSVAACGRQPDFDRLLACFGNGERDESYAAGLPDRILVAGERATQLGVEAPAGLTADLAAVAAAASSDQYTVFSPGDICPDNNMLTAGGIRFLDFEAAGYHSVFLDAAYIRMPFSTCWCVFRLPSELSAAAEAAYREQVCLIWPELADDDVWQPGIRRAVAAWTLSSMTWLLGRSLRADVPMNPEQNSPQTRQLMRYRWQRLAAELEPSGELPALVSLVHSLLMATTGWQAPELPLYPALR